jgi:hypothetical protein
VVDEGFHRFLHGCTGRGDDLVVIDLDGSGWHLVEALPVSWVSCSDEMATYLIDDPQRLSEFLYSTQVSVV